MTSCSWPCFRAWFSKYRKLLCGILARVLFIVHAACTTFIACSGSGFKPYIYLLFLPIVLLILESFVTMHLMDNKEWKWFTPSIAIYQLATVPSIWVMEYQSYTLRTNNQTVTDCGDVTDIFNQIADTNFTRLSADVGAYCKCGTCTPIMEQVLLLLMIVGRWILPTRVSSDQKAQLLLVNIAVASDILELFEMMKEQAVKDNLLLITIVLTLWAASLIQFAIVSTATAKFAPRGCACFETEIWSLVTLLCLDDLPFFTLRLVLIIKYKVLSNSSLFFTVKNALVLSLDINRLFALTNEIRKKKRAMTRKKSKRQLLLKDIANGSTRDDIEAELIELDYMDEECTLSHIRR